MAIARKENVVPVGIHFKGNVTGACSNFGSHGNELFSVHMKTTGHERYSIPITACIGVWPNHATGTGLFTYVVYG